MQGRPGRLPTQVYEVSADFYSELLQLSVSEVRLGQLKDEALVARWGRSFVGVLWLFLCDELFDRDLLGDERGGGSSRRGASNCWEGCETG